MADLVEARTVALDIYEAADKNAEDWRRGHLGASVVGGECPRAMWYSFRWAAKPDFTATMTKTRAREAWTETDLHAGRMNLLFEDGHSMETKTVARLRAAGYQVLDTNPETGGQWGLSWGHFGGSTDGMIQNTTGEVRYIPFGDDLKLSYAWQPDEWLVLEIKSADKKPFNEVRRHGLAKANAKYWAQAQIYVKGMRDQHEAPAEGALHITTCKGDSRIEVQFVPHDEEAALGLVGKGIEISTGDIPPPRPWGSPDEKDSWACRFCDYREVCWDGVLPNRSCRTCASVTVTPTGGWLCDRDKEATGLSVPLGEADLWGPLPLSCHRHNPHAISLECSGAHVDDNGKPVITYKTSTGGTVVDDGPTVGGPARVGRLTRAIDGVIESVRPADNNTKEGQ